MLLDAARQVATDGHSIAAVITSLPAPEYTVGEEAFSRFATDTCAEFACIRGGGDAALRAVLLRARADVAISVNCPVVLSAATLQLLPEGVYNAHAGDLPRYRGNACPNWAIIAGEREVGCTVHKMVEELDAGPIAAQERFPLSDDTYISAVYEWLSSAVPRLLGDTVRRLAAEDLVLRPQHDTGIRPLRCYARQPDDGNIDWTRKAADICRLVRASAEPFAGAFASLRGRRCIIWRAVAIDYPDDWHGYPGQIADIDRLSGDISVMCGEGMLRIQQIELPDSGRVSPASVVHSTRHRLSAGSLAPHLAPPAPSP